MSNTIIPPPPGHEPEGPKHASEEPTVDARELPERVTGYRDQTEEQIQLVNEVKNLEIQVASVWKAHHDLPHTAEYPAERGRQLALARTALEQAFMHWCRAHWAPENPFIQDVEPKT